MSDSRKYSRPYQCILTIPRIFRQLFRPCPFAVQQRCEVTEDFFSESLVEGKPTTREDVICLLDQQKKQTGG